MRNPGGKGFSRGQRVSFRGGRRDRWVAVKPRLKPACSREEPLPWSPKESLSPPDPVLHPKLGVGKLIFWSDRRCFFFRVEGSALPIFPEKVVGNKDTLFYIISHKPLIRFKKEPQKRRKEWT
jgi:hypothetical protein